MSSINDQNYVVPDSPTKKRRNSIESQTPSGLTLSFTMIVAGVAAPLLIFTATEIRKRLPDLMPELAITNKQYTDFSEFYKFYLSEHQHEDNRLLHYAATTYLLQALFFDERLFCAFAIAVAIGYNVFQCTLFLDNGYVEMIVLLSSALILGGLFTGSIWKPFKVMLVSYSLAWIGHFIFEENRPATFIYPTFSLIGDLKMFFEWCLPLLQRLMNKVVAKFDLDESVKTVVEKFSNLFDQLKEMRGNAN